MKQLRLTLLVCLLNVSVLAGAVSADVVLSQSNDPGAALNSELVKLFGQERVALVAVNSRHVDRIHARPKTSRRSSKSKTAPSYSREFLASQPVVQGDAEWRCLTEALYFEARGESVRGQFAVAEVILNRVDSGMFPGSVCKVVNQGTGRKFQCQFTYTCDGQKETIHDVGAWNSLGKIAYLMLNDASRNLTGGATHYHTKAVRPRWARVFPLTTTIGVHRFYRMPTRTASNG